MQHTENSDHFLSLIAFWQISIIFKTFGYFSTLRISFKKFDESTYHSHETTRKSHIFHCHLQGQGLS